MMTPKIPHAFLLLRVATHRRFVTILGNKPLATLKIRVVTRNWFEISKQKPAKSWVARAETNVEMKTLRQSNRAEHNIRQEMELDGMSDQLVQVYAVKPERNHGARDFPKLWQQRNLKFWIPQTGWTNELQQLETATFAPYRHEWHAIAIESGENLASQVDIAPVPHMTRACFR